MKIVISRKHTGKRESESSLINALNSGFGNVFKVMTDDEVDAYIEAQALRGNVCFSFDYTGTFHAQTTVIKAQAA